MTAHRDSAHQFTTIATELEERLADLPLDIQIVSGDARVLAKNLQGRRVYYVKDRPNVIYRTTMLSDVAEIPRTWPQTTDAIVEAVRGMLNAIEEVKTLQVVLWDVFEFKNNTYAPSFGALASA